MKIKKDDYGKLVNELKGINLNLLNENLRGPEEEKLVDKLIAKSNEISSACKEVKKTDEEHAYSKSLYEIDRLIEDLEVLLKVLHVFAKSKIEIYCD